MKKYIIHQKGAGALASAVHRTQQICLGHKPEFGAQEEGEEGGGGAGILRAITPGPDMGSRREVIKLGLDIHSKVYVVVAQHGNGTPKPARRFTPEEFAPWAEGLVRAGHEVHVVYEACGFGFGLCRRLNAAGAHCHVIAPRKLDEARTGVKTDPRDALTLCQRLSRYLEGNVHELAVIRVPSEEEEKARQVPRQRQQLVHARQKIEAQGRCLLVNHGLPTAVHWWKEQTWGRLRKLLPEWLHGPMEGYRPALLDLDRQIGKLGAQIEASAPADLPTGLGKLTAMLALREVCDWNRFNNRRQVSSHAGLCPGEHSSGNSRVQGSITKHGNPRLRAALVECAWRLVRFQPDWGPVKKRLHILAKGAKATGAARKKAIVAVARHLAVALWRLFTGRSTAAQLGLRIPEPEPVAAQSAVAKPEAVKSVVKKPVVAQSVVAQSVVAQSVVAQSVAAQSVAAQSVVAKPEAVKSVVKKPVVANPAAVKPAAAKPVAGEPATAKNPPPHQPPRLPRPRSPFGRDSGGTTPAAGPASGAAQPEAENQ